MDSIPSSQGPIRLALLCSAFYGELEMADMDDTNCPTLLLFYDCYIRVDESVGQDNK